MSLRNVPLFAAGFPTTFLMRQWTAKGALTPLHLIAYLDGEQTATPAFRAVWQAAFPTRSPLPSGPLADRSGKGTDAFWNVFA